MSRPHLPSFALSAEERAVVANRDIFAAKARAQATCREALLATHAALADIVRTVPLAAPTGLRAEAFQLVKGESLEDCPYQYLDYPKYFVRGEAFTFRTLIWWGHHLVCAWLIEGASVPARRRALLAHYPELVDRDVRLGIAPGLWEWKVGDGYTLPLRADNRTQVAAVLERRTTLKLCRAVPFDHPDFVAGRIPALAVEAFRAMLPVVRAE
ncbi:MAG: hypothetical protein U0172_08370 [Nitrospiraceae bacterium]